MVFCHGTTSMKQFSPSKSRVTTFIVTSNIISKWPMKINCWNPSKWHRDRRRMRTTFYYIKLKEFQSKKKLITNPFSIISSGNRKISKTMKHCKVIGSFSEIPLKIRLESDFIIIIWLTIILLLSILPISTVNFKVS